jgi:hypothetical protein
MPSKEQTAPSQEESRLHKFKTLSTSVLKFGFGSFLLCVVGAVLIASFFWGRDEWVKRQEEKQERALEGRNLRLVAPGIKGSASLSLKYAKHRKLKYNFNFTISEGFSGEQKGSVTLRFLDKDNFEVLHHSFKNLTPIVDSDRIAGYSELGEIENIDPHDFVSTTHIDVIHSLTITKIPPPESEASSGKIKPKLEDNNREHKARDLQVEATPIVDISNLKVNLYSSFWELEGIVKNSSAEKVANSLKVRIIINDESNEQILSVGDTIKEINDLSIPPGQGRKISESLNFGKYPPRVGSKWSYKLSIVEAK